MVLLTVGCAAHERLNLLLDCTPERLVDEIATPAEAAEIIDMRMRRQVDPALERFDDWRSLSESLASEAGDCDDWAIASAALLADDGFPAKLLIVGSVRVFIDTEKNLVRRGNCHAVHLLERDGLYGANGVNRADRVEPRFTTIEALVRRLPLIQDRWEFYKIVPLDGVDIVGGQGNLFEQIADRYKAANWIDVTYPRTATTRMAHRSDRAHPPRQAGAAGPRAGRGVHNGTMPGSGNE